MRRLHGAPCAPLLPCCHCQHTVEASSAGDPNDGRPGYVAHAFYIARQPPCSGVSWLVPLSSLRCYLRVSERLCYLLPNCTACIDVLFRRSLHYLSFMLPIVARRPPCSCVWWLRCLRAAVSVCVFRDCTTYCTTALLHFVPPFTALLRYRTIGQLVPLHYDNCSNLDATGPLLPALLLHYRTVTSLVLAG